ncbi:glycine-rich domain-containing protein, partial [Catellatospora bangladeshensis]
MTTLLDQNQRDAIPDQVASLLVKDVQQQFPTWSVNFCQRGVSQMVGFLAACAVAPEPLGPSTVVDRFWHAFIIRTRDYTDFCEKVAGRYIHHIPQDEREHDPRLPGTGSVIRSRTISAIEASGHAVDLEFWPELGATDCTQCYQGCHDSPK